MAVYNSAISVLKGIRTEFAVGIGDYTPMFGPIMTTVNSNSNLEDYKFWRAFPRIKEWIDEIHRESMKDYKYTIRNKPWEFSIPVDRYTLADSKAGSADVELQTKEAIKQWKDFPDELIYDLLIDNGTCYDGSAFFATSHNIDGDNAIDNLLTGTSTSLAQVEADLAAAITAMRGYRDKNDRPINKNPRWLVLCPAHMELTFKTLQGSSSVYVSGTKTNIYEGQFDILINDWQSGSDDDWFLVNQNAVLKPFIYQLRDKPTWEKEDIKTLRDILFFSVARMAAGYGGFTSICKTDN